jgi:serine/threonine protein kinase
MAPEILNNQPYSLKSDVFSAGIVMFFMLTREMLFRGKTVDDILSANQECDISPILHHDMISEPDKRFLVSLLNPNPHLRPTSE